MKKSIQPLSAVRRLTFFPVLAAGAWILYSYLGIDHEHDLSPALDAERRTFASREAGVLSYYADRSVKGRPLLLIHSINAAASPFEMRPIFDHYRKQRPVYALDLPGYGFSDRTDRTYSPTLFKDAIIALLQTQVKEEGPVDVVALSLGCEFAALAAKEHPELIRSLTFISPTGFTRRENKPAVQSASGRGVSDTALRFFQVPLWSQALYDLLVTKPSIRFFLRMNFEGEVNPQLLAYAYETTHRPGARFAPLHFISGKLFTSDIREAAYEQLTQPALVIYDYDPNVGFDHLPEMLNRFSNWHASRIVPTRGLPHWEKMPETAAALDSFWGSL